ncbi:DUF4232 domain-containing protein [Nocardia sp. NPDC060256]|uniref:DUF4232 domain-containing protein n=1 Tax=unclassified Nocardia TaxID=2637762 RepID=UPI00366805BD
MRGTALVILAAALPLTACGSSSPDSSTTATTPPAAASSHRTPTVATTPTTSVVAAPDGVPLCASGDLTVSLGQQGGAAGSIYVPIIFTNTGPTPCALSGYPAVSLAAGNPPAPLGPEAEPDNTAPATPAPVTVAPTESAHAILRYSQAGNYDCERAPAQYLLIHPPNQPTAVTKPFTAEACIKPAYLLLHIDPIKPGKEN